MLEITEAQIDAWIAAWFWPFTRIAACMMVAPIFGARFVPMRVRLVLSLAVTVVAAPLLPAPPDVGVFSATGIVITAQQVMIGVAIGFMMQLIFDAIGLGGQLIANSMGLSFAFNVDPSRGASTPALGQFYLLLTTMTFVALDGHLALIELLVRGFQVLPPGTEGLGSVGLRGVASFASTMFAGALSVALPGMTALLIVNMAFGVMSRAAPTLNLFGVGFPIMLVFGLGIVVVGLPLIQSTFASLMAEAFRSIAALQGMES
jgi:flagellar biosynthetic protein FliR